jgi:protein-S-isoprenylcysteine O-methyltransferase Ste14
MVNWKLVLSFIGTFSIPLLYLINIQIASKTPGSFDITLPLSILGILISFFGLIFWALSYVNLGKSFGVLPKEQKKVKRGLYKYFDHPMYIGIYATFLGISMAQGSWQSLLFLNAVLLPILILRARIESKKLID